MESANKLLLNVKEVSALTGFSVGTLYHFISEGRIPVVRLSRRAVRFTHKDIQNWISSLTVPERQAVRNRHSG